MKNERFDNTVGCHYSPEYLCSLSDDELVSEIRSLDSWDVDLCRELCYRADLLDEWCEADADDTEKLIYTAAERLGVSLDDTITTSRGEIINFEAVANAMDSELSEEINEELAPCTDQEFYDEYCRRHIEKFGEEFAPDAGLAW